MTTPETFWRKKRVLITGGAGFVGSNLAHYFQTYHPETEVYVFDCFRSEERFEGGNLKSLGHFKNLIGFKGEVISGNILNPDDLERLNAYRFDVIFHQAAISDTTVMDQELMIRANTNAFGDLLRIASGMGARMVYASSAGTYGNSPAPNHVGSGEVPENVYGFSKLMMDHLAMRFVREHPECSVVGLRYFNVYGPREVYKGTTASMILQLGIQAISKGRIRLFKHGEQKRDFVYVEDVVQANLKAAQSGACGVFNVGYGVARSFNDIVAALKRHLGEFEVEFIDNPYRFYQNHTQADIAPTCAELGYAPAFDLERGVEAYMGEIRAIAQEGA